MNYYDEILFQVRNNIKKNEYKKANKIILDELAMPYIPEEYNKKFNDLNLEIKKHLLYLEGSKKTKPTNFDKTTIFEIINKYDDTLTPIALMQLKDLNLRDCIADLKNIFSNSEIKNAIKVLILEYINNQKINLTIDVKTKYDNVSIETNKHLIFTPDFNNLITLIEQKLHKNPSLLNICISYTNQFMINLFPIIYKYDPNDELIFINIAKKSMNIDTELPKSLIQKSLFINNIIKRYIYNIYYFNITKRRQLW